MSRLQRHFLNLSNECSFGGDRICCSGEDHLMGHGENLRVRWLPVRMEEFPELLQLLVPEDVRVQHWMGGFQASKQQLVEIVMSENG